MKNIGKRLILVSFILALITSILIFLYLNSLKTPKSIENKVTVFVSTENIPPKTKIDKKMVKEIIVHENEFLGDYIKEYSNIIGKYTKETILKGEGFHKEKLTNELVNELSIKIDENHRAVSINVSGESGVSDLIKQGNFVDVIAYLPEKKDGQNLVSKEISKIILQNIQVLAVDKAFNSDNNVERKEIPKNYLVTLSIPVSDIEKLVLVEDIGKLKLALRPQKSNDTYNTEGITSEELLNNLNDIKNAVNEEKKNLQDNKVIKNNNEQEYIYYTIKKGDTLMKISRDFYGVSEKYKLLKEVNGIQDVNEIIEGEKIKIPITK